jgi:hypothetical protein
LVLQRNSGEFAAVRWRELWAGRLPAPALWLSGGKERAANAGEALEPALGGGNYDAPGRSRRILARIVMNFVIKVAVAFGIGIAAMTGLQTAGLFSLKSHLTSDAAHRGIPQMKPAFADMKVRPFEMPKTPPIDVRAGQDAAMRGFGSQMDRQIRAATTAAPQPVRIPGMR